MSQINSKIKDDFQVVLLLFRGTPCTLIWNLIASQKLKARKTGLATNKKRFFTIYIILGLQSFTLYFQYSEQTCLVCLWNDLSTCTDCKHNFKYPLNQEFKSKWDLLARNCEPCKLLAIPRKSAQLRTIARNSTQSRATEFRLETPVLLLLSIL